MKIQVPTSSDTSSGESSIISTESEYISAPEYSVIDRASYSEVMFPNPNPDGTNQQPRQEDPLGSKDTDMDRQNQTSLDYESLSRLAEAIERAPAATKALISSLMNQSNSRPQETSDSVSISRDVMKRDCKFDKWDGESHSWPPHFFFLKMQCKVYLPLLVTEEAVCMKIYESIPEPQRQRIRGYWMRIGQANVYDHKELLEECNNKFFDKIGAEKAEKRLHSMRQGEAQIFRKFLQEWELQLEYAGG
ncbi:hypothetical protein K3495_g16165, partial [Podosphaera aphanis]